MSETAKEPKKISKRSSEEKIEIIVAIFLGITALATAWASWIGSLHGGNQATNYTKATTSHQRATRCGMRLLKILCRI